jgi:hypothetical protein
MARKIKDWTPKRGILQITTWSPSTCKSRENDQIQGSKLFNTPRTTLSRRLSLIIKSPASKPTVLYKKEQISLVSRILEMKERGFGLTISDVCQLAYSIMEHLGRKNPLTVDPPPQKKTRQDVTGGGDSGIVIHVYHYGNHRALVLHEVQSLTDCNHRLRYKAWKPNE